MTTGENMRRARQRRRVTAKKLGDMAGVGVSTIYNAEKDRAVPTIYTVARLADALNISIDEYVRGV